MHIDEQGRFWVMVLRQRMLDDESDLQSETRG
jgi:hypothetical protein